MIWFDGKIRNEQRKILKNIRNDISKGRFGFKVIFNLSDFEWWYYIFVKFIMKIYSK